MRIEDLDYALPAELIAQEPASERSSARLLVVRRGQADVEHRRVVDLPALLRPHDLLVLNDTRVIPARVHGRRPTGGRLEVLFVRPSGDGGEWDAIVRGSPRVGERVHFDDDAGTWTANLGDGAWRLRLDGAGDVLGWLERHGEVPLPPYIERAGGPSASDVERYQTTFARVPGAVAAPTAGLHFTPALLDALEQAGVDSAMVTLHVGPGTFLPIRGGDLSAYTMASEPYDVPLATVGRIDAARAAGGRVVAIGTTVVRTLESAARSGRLVPGHGDADLFIRPGHDFRVVDAMITNFHLPRTPLLALVAALLGWERLRGAYDEAVRSRYRLYSFGDAMLIT